MVSYRFLKSLKPAGTILVMVPFLRRGIIRDLFIFWTVR
jgi:hypothetical protein